MPEVLPYLAFALSAYGTIENVQSQKKQEEAQSASVTAANEAEKKRLADQQAAEKAQLEQSKEAAQTNDAAAIRQRLTQLQAQSGGMASSDWLQSVLSSEFPNETPDALKNAIDSYVSSAGSGSAASGSSSTGSSSTPFYTGG